MVKPLVFGHEELSREQLLLDRGLHYGDGLFETIALVQGQMPLLDAHLSRLKHSCITLFGRFPEDLLLQRLKQLSAVISNYRHGVVKLIVTRGVSGRGYGADPSAPLRVFAYLYEYQPMAYDQRLRGLNIMRCRTSISAQPVLGNIKHLNRLEQVMARAEVDTAKSEEGVLCLSDGTVVEACSSNILCKIDGHWLTPDLAGAGIRGVARQLLVEKNLVQPASIHFDELASATAIALINSVAGLVPVNSLLACHFPEKPKDILAHFYNYLPPHIRGEW